MRGFRLALVCTSAFLFATVACAQDPYTGFRVPEARSLTWLVSGNARWNGSYESLFGSSHDLSRWSADALSAMHQHGESEAFVSDHFVEAEGRWQQYRATDRYASGLGGQVYDYALDFQQLAALGSTSTTRYLGASGWGVDAALSASYTYARNASANGSGSISGPFESHLRNDSQVHNYLGSLSASLGPGYGRVRDVTGVFDMQVLEERLTATGRLSHPLSPAARQHLAELFSVSGDFQAAHDRPDRYLWREVERILAEDGAIEAGTLDAWSLLRALEPATLSISVTRLEGWRVSGAYELAMEQGHLDQDQQSTAVSLTNGIPTSSSGTQASSHRSNEENRGFARLDVAWHRPFGMRWQADLASTGRYGDGPRRQVIANSALGLTYVLADRWVVTAAATHVISSALVDSTRSSPAWTVHGVGQLSYFFEDSWSITAGVDHMQARPLFVVNDQPAVPMGYLRQTEVVVGLTYRPLGRFEAPGLGVTQRLAPGGI